MRNTKKCSLYIIAILLMVISLGACSGKLGGDKPNQKKKVALIVKMDHGDYWNTVKMGAEAAAKEFDVNLLYNAPEYEEDASVQIELVNEALKNGADAIVLAASDYKSVSQAITRADHLNIPVITIDSEVDSPYVQNFIGTDNYDAGKKAGQKLIQVAGDNCQVAIMSFVKGARNAEQREKGLLDELAHHPQVKVVDTEYSLSDEKRAGELTRKLIANYPKLDGIVALNAIASIGTATEIQKMGLGGKVKLITFDNTPEEMELLQDGVIQATLIQNPFSMGYLGVKYAVDVMNGRDIPKRVDTGTNLVDLTNMFSPENEKLLLPFVK